MKKAAWSFLAFAVAFPYLAATSALAQDGRVIDEEIVLMDPTVSAPQKWAAGASAEYWYMAGPYKTKNAAGEVTAKGNINGSIPGGNVFIGYDKFTLQYSHREGFLNIKQTDTDNTNVIYNSKDRQIEEEVTLRYLFKANKHLSPYVLVGYNETSLEVRKEIEANSGFVWAYNMTRFHGERTTYSSGLVGLGAIVPLNERIGFRADGRLLYTRAVYARDDQNLTRSGSGIGGGATGTVYVNIVKGLNVQAGLKGQVLNGGKNVGAYGRIGMFASAGYSHKF